MLALPENLRRLVDSRIAALPKLTQEVLLAASALPPPTVDVVKSVMPGRSVESLRALERAAAAGVIRIDGPRIRFTHPLYAAGVYASAPPQVRRLVHRRLAPLVDEIEERARHLALGAEVPRRKACGHCCRGGRTCPPARSARRLGAELLEHAVALTPREQTLERQAQYPSLGLSVPRRGGPPRPPGAGGSAAGDADGTRNERMRCGCWERSATNEHSFATGISLLEGALRYVGGALR